MNDVDHRAHWVPHFARLAEHEGHSAWHASQLADAYYETAVTKKMPATDEETAARFLKWLRGRR